MVEPTGPGIYVDSSAEIAESAVVGPRVVIGPRCRIEAGRGGARIGPARGLRDRGRRHGRAARSSPPASRSAPGAALDGAVVGRDERVPADDTRRPVMLDDVLAMPDHLRDALWRVESARLEAADSAGLLVCGMGGSAIGGDLAAAAARRAPQPPAGHRARLPAARLGRPPTGRCSARATRAGPRRRSPASRRRPRLGARRIVVSTGGRPGRPGPGGGRRRSSACPESCSRGPRSPT